MKAILTNLLTGERIPVESTTEHSACSYGQAVWVDENNEPYGQCNLPLFGYEIEEIIEEDE